MGGPGSGRRQTYERRKIALPKKDWAEFDLLADLAGDTHAAALREIHKDGLPAYRAKLRARGINVD